MRYTYRDIEIMATALMKDLEVDERDSMYDRYYMDLLRIFAAANEPLWNKEY